MTREDALKTLQAGVGRFAQDVEFRRYLDVRARFRTYSFTNSLMIAFQRPDSTLVAGFHKWLTLGRAVRKGEKGIAIWAPMMYAKKDAETGEKTGEILRGFRVVHVFDVSQTDGKPLPKVEPKLLEGSDGREIFDALREFAEHGGLVVTLKIPTLADANGEYDRVEREIRIHPDRSMLQKAKTLAHECAHWILHSTDEGRAAGKEVRETEAEAAAFLVLARFGLAADEYSFSYIAHWSAGDPKVLQASLARIDRAAEEIVRAITSRVGTAETSAAADMTAA